MKKYKGWEIAKLISEGKLEGKKLMLWIHGEKYHHYKAKNKVMWDGDREVGSSLLTDAGVEYTICQEPVSFMDCINLKGEVRVEHEVATKVFEHIHIPGDLSAILYHLSSKLCHEDLCEVIKNGKWYTEEDLIDGE